MNRKAHDYCCRDRPGMRDYSKDVRREYAGRSLSEWRSKRQRK